MSRFIGSFERARMRALWRVMEGRSPAPPPPAVAPLSGRLPALGDEVEVLVHEVNRYTRPWSTVPTWVRDRVSELRYQDATPGFTTAERGAQPWLSEEGRHWRWPKGATAGASAPLKGAP